VIRRRPLLGLSGILISWLVVGLACRGPAIYPTVTEPTGTATPSPTESAPTAATTPIASPVPLPRPTPFPTPNPTPPPPISPIEPTPLATPTSPSLSSPTPTSLPVQSVARVITRLETTQAVIALTFDCGADRGYAEEILDELARHGIRATFGMTGAWARANPDLVARMLREGHRLINHSDTHPSFTGRSTGSPPLPVDQRAAEIRGAEQAVAAVSGSETTMRPYFRPPYGDYDEALLTLLPELGYSVVVMWTVDSLGWRGIPPEEVVTRVLAAAQPGAIVLLHVGAQSTDAAALPQLIAALQERGYGFVTIDTQPG